MWYRIAIFFVRLARTGEFSLPGIGNYINYTLTVDKFKNPALIFKKIRLGKEKPPHQVWCGGVVVDQGRGYSSSACPRRFLPRTFSSPSLFRRWLS